MIWKHTGYSINEALGYGVPIVTTPLTVLNELPITDNEHIVLDWDCKNVKDVVKQIFEKDIKPFEYNPPQDEWEKQLVLNRSNYEEEKRMKFLVEATDKYVNTNTFDSQRSEEESEKQGKKIDYYPPKGEQWIVDYERKEKLVNLGFVKVIEEIQDSPIEKAVPVVDTEKATPKKRTSKKTTK